MVPPTPQPDPIIPTWLTPLLAIWGAFLSSVALGWNLFRDLTERPKAKVEAKVRRLVTPLGGQWYSISPTLNVEGASRQLFIVMTVVNVRRRAIRWVGWGSVYKKPEGGKNGCIYIPRGLPKTLSEADMHGEYTELEADSLSDNVRRLQAWDSTGRVWKISWLRMQTLRREAREALAHNGGVTTGHEEV
jgi:hypothetical protein